MCIYGYKWRKGHLNTSHVILYPISLKFTENQLSFKYISCYSLSKNCQRGILVWRNLNTSHVILYLLIFHHISDMNLFKYISCYSLSSFHPSGSHKTQKFKYISCYSLSRHRYIFINQILIFKYISCYSLSFTIPPSAGASTI